MFQVKPLRNTDIDKSTLGHVIFCHENFKRDRKDLLVNITRYTRGTGINCNLQQQQRQIDLLMEKYVLYERHIAQLTARMDLMEKSFSALVAQLNLNRSEHVQQFASTSLEQPTRKVAFDNRTVPDSHHILSQPSLKYHPSATDGLPPSSIPSVSQGNSLVLLGESFHILHESPYEYESGNRANKTDSNSSRRSPQPTLKLHPSPNSNPNDYYLELDPLEKDMVRMLLEADENDNKHDRTESNDDSSERNI